ncbi:MAG: peptidase S51, partial [Ruminococcaceae bacterium]|nr:peptidase S51 [Oscillospiraceae bacterium]
MINILLEGYDIDAPWLYNELKKYIQPNHSVVVVAFSFRENRVKNLSDWNALYDKKLGKFYNGIVDGFTSYGILEDNIVFINYFTDTKETAAQKIKNADIVYFLGGMPDRMMDRIKEFNLYDTLMQHKGIVMGYSAGAVIQLAEYHLSPDDDYPEFNYYEGLPYLQ